MRMPRQTATSSKPCTPGDGGNPSPLGEASFGETWLVHVSPSWFPVLNPSTCSRGSFSISSTKYVQQLAREGLPGVRLIPSLSGILTMQQNHMVDAHGLPLSGTTCKSTQRSLWPSLPLRLLQPEQHLMKPPAKTMVKSTRCCAR